MKALFIGVVCILSVLISQGYSRPNKKRPEIHPKGEPIYLDQLTEYLRYNNFPLAKEVPGVTTFDKHEETNKNSKPVEHNAKQNNGPCKQGKGGDKCEMRNKPVEHNAKHTNEMQNEGALNSM
uniref:Uncharacterized protein n=1 Tax=Trichobilharzia regenti TaxID=157069 RepID=A0AA85JHM5_TRIRE|nr:unnamed protein product [Trichobilharzia regenti]